MAALPSPAAVLGPLLPGHPIARRWTFTRKRWTPLSYIFRVGSDIYITSVQAEREGRGYFRDLISEIEAYGLAVVVPNPLETMRQILEHYGFEPKDERPQDSTLSRREWLNVHTITIEPKLARMVDEVLAKEGIAMTREDCVDVWRRPKRRSST
jgi:hypothetical protein